MKLLDYNLPLFKGVSEADLALVRPVFVEKHYDSWDILFDLQTNTRDVYFLISGSLLAVYWTKEGREIIFSRIPTGTYLGELAALDNDKRSLAVMAKNKARVIIMPQAVFLNLFDKVPLIRERVIHGLVSRIRQLTAKNLELTTFSVEQRVSSYLLSLALERGKLETGGVVDDAPTHAEIAASIGANREMVSRVMTRLSRKGAISSSRKRIELLDLDALSCDL